MTEWRLAAEKEAAPGADTEQWSCHQSRDTTTGHQTAAAPSAVELETKDIRRFPKISQLRKGLLLVESAF